MTSLHDDLGTRLVVSDLKQGLTPMYRQHYEPAVLKGWKDSQLTRGAYLPVLNNMMPDGGQDRCLVLPRARTSDTVSCGHHGQTGSPPRSPRSTQTDRVEVEHFVETGSVQPVLRTARENKMGCTTTSNHSNNVLHQHSPLILRQHNSDNPGQSRPFSYSAESLADVKRRGSARHHGGENTGRLIRDKVQIWIENHDSITEMKASVPSEPDTCSRVMQRDFRSVKDLSRPAQRCAGVEGEMDSEEEVKTLECDDPNTTNILRPSQWDKFQTVSRDKVETRTNFRSLLQGIKVLAYFLFFVLVLGSAVVAKLSLLTMTSGVLKGRGSEDGDPTKTMLLIVLGFPHCWCMLTYSVQSVFGNDRWPSVTMTISILVLESLQTFGTCLLLFKILPGVDLIRALLLLTSVLIVPALCRTISTVLEKTATRWKRCVTTLVNLFALSLQLGSVVTCTVSGLKYSETLVTLPTVAVAQVSDTVTRGNVVFWSNISWEIPVSLVLCSITAWENYIHQDVSIIGLRFPFTSWKRNLHLVRQRLYVFVSVWKLGLSVLLVLLLCDDFHFSLTFNDELTRTEGGDPGQTHYVQYGVLYFQIAGTFLCSYIAGLACKTCMQRFSFSLPLCLTTPVSAVVVYLQCQYNFIPFPGDVFVWVCPSQQDPWLLFHLIQLGLVCLSQIIITAHVWMPDSSRMAKLERLFITPVRCGVFTDTSLLLRRRRDDHDRALLSNNDETSMANEDFRKSDVTIPIIYACATMWHETVEEMTLLLKSIFRMDIDHSARYLAQKYYGINDPDYYEFEAHIFFDDAMELTEDDTMVPNSFVADLISCVDEALSAVHVRQFSLGPPTRTPTPYGGQLTWNLPGGTQLTVHMKNKARIRHKKRWSQVMYMYYLFGYRILSETDTASSDDLCDATTSATSPEAHVHRRKGRAHHTRSTIFNKVNEDIQIQADNTFILALDGDVDFQPDAVRLLVDRMRKNKKVGAACGRIHPTGSGPIIWYQMFEYAIGHWLQKSTEHVFGCVLCAPGCFTLFRGSALMDDNITRTYAKLATQAGQCVQYDQGEDRWLSTLLLQQGYRIDYCAASDAFTHAPETFSEFFNQRRRWGPSTLANILDLLGTWRSVVRINDNLSSLYVFYQAALLLSTILGPATVLLMMAGAYSVVFKTSIVTSHVISLFPAVSYVVVCMYTSSNTQLLVGAVLSAIYSVIMTVVLVGTVRTAIDGTITSPNVIFVIMLSFIFIVSGFMHPSEFSCIIPGVIYFICIPTSFLVLNIYYLCNLNVVSWGTREAPKKKTKAELEREKREAQLKIQNKKKKGILSVLGIKHLIAEIGDVCSQIKSIICESFKLSENSSRKKTDQLLEELIMEIRHDRLGMSGSQFSRKSKSICETITTTDQDEIEQRESILQSKPEPSKEARLEFNDSVPSWLEKEDSEHPGWLSSVRVGAGTIVHLPERETLFWKQFIHKYLQPLADDTDHKAKMTADLRTLRNNIVFAFSMVTALWVAFFLQMEILQEELEDQLYVKIPRLDNRQEPLTFQPVGLAFFAFFAVIIIFQFIGMLIHRWGTMLHMLSITEITCGQNFTEKEKVKGIILKVTELQKLRDIEYEPEPDYDEPLPDYDTRLDVGVDGTSVDSGSARAPPSYHVQDIPAAHRRRLSRRRSDIFDGQGQPTANTLQNVFEKRYRNEILRTRTITDHHNNSGQNTFVDMQGYSEPNFTHY